MRSVAGNVSNACAIGATSTDELVARRRVLMALPTSAKSCSRTVVDSDGTHPNILRCTRASS
jgi:hypothetical protein